ncbi:hypothetical protein QA584_04080 [Anaerocolumna sp. AGMB13025]|uniref:hypothetical protein n=1 Tax=Anaerocolumna sp. AGMB13025 TaxID=3039116 RepID=UPI00241F03F5|nr:hypothetical protein [Anaerocolumna sp. AGMB13025]WFR58254.1 hypothetical protein QA584_04080 [Anaerocolumna sp. AGMB13025]
MATYDESIELIINRMGISKDDIPDFIYDYLIKIEQLATEIKENQTRAVEHFKKSKFNASYVSKQINCSRTTLYNNEILIQYIDKREIELNKNNPYVKISELNDIIDELRKEVDMHEIKDVKIELIIIENEQLANELKTLKIDVDNLKMEIEKKDKEIRTFRKNALKSGE